MVRKIGQAKAELAADYAVQLARSAGKVVFFAKHLDVMDTAEEIFARRGVRAHVDPRRPDPHRARRQAIDAFVNDPDVQVIVCSLTAAGVGINLQVSSNVVLAELSWTNAEQTQAIDRVHRIGQTEPVTAWRIIAAQTIDAKIAELIDSKAGLAARALDGAGRGGRRRPPTSRSRRWSRSSPRRSRRRRSRHDRGRRTGLECGKGPARGRHMSGHEHPDRGVPRLHTSGASDDEPVGLRQRAGAGTDGLSRVGDDQCRTGMDAWLRRHPAHPRRDARAICVTSRPPCTCRSTPTSRTATPPTRSRSPRTWRSRRTPGIAGLSIEDSSDDPADPFFEV